MSNLQYMYPSSGLMRYHSAPSSLLASLVDAEAQLTVSGDSASFAPFAETDFAQFLDNHLCSFMSNSSSVLESILPKAASAGSSDSQCPSLRDIESSTYHGINNAKLQLEADQSFIFEEAHSPGSTTVGVSPNPMSSALASGLVETTLAASTSCGSAPMKLAAHALPSSFSNSANSPLECCASTANIAMQSSLFRPPSDTTANSDSVKLAIRGANGTEIPRAQTINALRPSIQGGVGLLRQHSSPADFISHLSNDVGLPSTRPRVLMSGNSFKEDNIGRGAGVGLYTVGSHGQDFRNMQHNVQLSDCTSILSREAVHYGKASSSRLMETEVLCRVSAKRGCATHPRSIAERVRRTKINESIKKLQDLVPVTDKSANTVTMLDEAVEYIKRLQRQVQELSACRQQCNGLCHSEGNIDIKQ